MFQKISSITHQVVTLLYSHLLKKPLSYLGLQQTIKNVYLSIILKLSSETIQISVADTTIELLTVAGWFKQNIQHNIETERPVIEDLLENLNSNDVFYDIGGNFGVYSCLAASKGARTVVFEPINFNIKILKKNLILNGLDATVLNYALTSGNKSNEWLQKQHATVQISSGDEIIDRLSLPAPNVIKLDIEGGELEALRGLKNTIQHEECRLIYCEVHPELENKREDHGLKESEIRELHSLIENSGFEIEKIHVREDHGDQPFIKAERV